MSSDSERYVRSPLRHVSRLSLLAGAICSRGIRHGSFTVDVGASPIRCLPGHIVVPPLPVKAGWRGRSLLWMQIDR
jgi:hypothetical protein